MVMVTTVMVWLQHILLWSPCVRWYSMQCKGISWYIRTKKIQKESEFALSSARTWHLDCSIHVLYKTWIFIDRLSRDNRSTSLTRGRTNGLEHYVWLHQISLINQLWHHWEWQTTFENIAARYLWGSRNILHVNLTPVKNYYH